MISVNIHEAKARLSELIRLMQKGEEVQICSRNEPLATLVPIEKKPKKKRVFGLHQGEVEVPDSFFEPMSKEELALWYDGPIFPDEDSREKS